MQTYYISFSSIFDHTPYRLQEYRNVLEKAGATTFVTQLNGWQNQPKVVGFFNITLKQAKDILSNLPEFEKWGPIIQVVDWRVNLTAA